MSPLNCKGIILEWMLRAFHPEASRINSAGLSGKDWVLLVKKAQKTGLNSRLIEMLNTSNHSGNIPPQILSSLTTARILAIQRNLMLLDEYRIISEKLNNHDLPHQSIKGLWILQHPELQGMSRITSDIDLLIPPENIGKTIDIIRMLGYQQNPIRSRFDSALNLQTGHHLTPFRNNNISLEIHYRALPGSSEIYNNELVQMS
ncbi:MAG: nucleotidyltransferase family protein, partial [Bacteroidota bacterium]|nr:nucleotidyltransferase family protein [Bacteroidota bacterium]